jgi:hypothetical protein
MNFLRRIVAFVVLASFAGIQPASAKCAIMSHADVRADEVTTHEHHTPESNAEQGDDSSNGSADAGLTCTLMLACAAAAIAPRSEESVGVAAVDLTHTTVVPLRTAPSLAFDPPPPRLS